MTCPRCGKEMPEGARLCPECSQAFAGMTPEPAPPRARTSGLAIASLVLGILGLLPLCSLLALIFGVWALVAIGKAKDRLRGQGLAIAGTVLGGLGVLFQVAMLTLLLPAFNMARETGQTTTCVSNARRVGLALQVYANDHDDALPAADRWQDDLAGYLKNTRALDCPSQPGPRNYALNRMIAGKRLRELAAPGETVLLVDAGTGPNANGGPELLGNPPHRARPGSAAGGRWVVAFADGHVRVMTAEELQSCRWEP